tara:strand:- start:3938 stop:5926 length:1989 start_codon:yes stop_codon:yes gene_type:complete
MLPGVGSLALAAALQPVPSAGPRGGTAAQAPSAAEQLRRDWRAAFATQQHEYADVPLSASHGELPRGLSGVLFKNGPARFERGGAEYAHWLDGDGYVTALRLGGADSSSEILWSGRYVRTEAYLEEESAESVRWRTTFGTQRPGGLLANIGDIKLKSPANTAVLPLPGGPLLALWEAGPPYALCPRTLRTLGPHSLGGRLRLSAKHGALPATTGVDAFDRRLESAGYLTDALSAHYRHDARRRMLVAWSWRQQLQADRIEVALHHLAEGGDASPLSSDRSAVDDNGAHGTAQSDAVPAPSDAVPAVRAVLEGVPFAPHDMAISRRHALFLTSPTRVQIAPFILGALGPAQCTTFDAEAIADGRGVRLHALRRDGALRGASGESAPGESASEGSAPDGSAPEGSALEGSAPEGSAPEGSAPEAASRVSAAPASVRVWESHGMPYHPVHNANAFEDEATRRLTLISSCWAPAAVRRLAAKRRDLLGSWEELLEGDFGAVPMTQLVRFVAHPATDALAHRVLASGAQLDHPKVNPRWESRKARYVWATMGRADDGGDADATPVAPQSFACVDLDALDGDGQVIDSWHAGTRRLVDEATVIPKEEGAGEREAFLIAPIFDGASRTTSYVVLDAADLASGPICELPLPTHIPWGLHGAWQGSYNSML